MATSFGKGYISKITPLTKQFKSSLQTNQKILLWASDIRHAPPPTSRDCTAASATPNVTTQLGIIMTINSISSVLECAIYKPEICYGFHSIQHFMILSSVILNIFIIFTNFDLFVYKRILECKLERWFPRHHSLMQILW